MHSRHGGSLTYLRFHVLNHAKIVSAGYPVYQALGTIPRFGRSPLYFGPSWLFRQRLRTTEAERIFLKCKRQTWDKQSCIGLRHSHTGLPVYRDLGASGQLVIGEATKP